MAHQFYKEKLLLLGSVIGSFGTVLSVTIPLLIASQIISWWMIVLIVTFVVLMVLAMTMVLIVVLKSDTPTKVYKSKTNGEFVTALLNEWEVVLSWRHEAKTASLQSSSQEKRQHQEIPVSDT